MTELQYAALTISLSTLGQADISGIEVEQLQTLAFLLEQALENVQKALKVSAPTQAAPDDETDARYGYRHSGE